MTIRRRIAQILIGTVLVFGAVIWTSYRSEHAIAGVALALAAIALWFSLMLGATLDNRVARIEALLGRIADTVAPVPSEPVFRFALVDSQSAESLGTVAFVRPDFSPGDVIPQGSGRSLRVVTVIA